MSTLIEQIPGLIYGCDYNPEQWPESIVEEDVHLMNEAGVNLVNVGIFSWALTNPAPGEFRFNWLERILDQLHQGGISVNLATGTASPPAWLTLRYPEILPVTREGVVLHHGSRQNYTPNSRAYREHSEALTEAIAGHFKAHPALVMWHPNNEYMCHVHSSHGPEDDRAFRIWLRDKYGSLDTLNQAWNTRFWSQIYYDWEEIHTPKATPAFINPSHELDFKRFMSAANQACFEAEKAILKKHTPEIPVVTNFMNSFQSADLFHWEPSIEIAALDSYPDPNPAVPNQNAPFDLDMMRSLKRGKPFMLMEQATDYVNWRQINHRKGPGVMRLWSLQAVARGADAIQFFQWRQSLAGAERFHSSMIPPVHPRPNATFDAVRGLGADLNRLAPLAGSLIEAECAILFDWETWWALSQQALPRDFDYFSIVKDFHDAFHALNIPVDLIPPGADLSRYKIVVAPSLFLLAEEEAISIFNYVEYGGYFLAGFFTGVSDRNNRVFQGGFPGHLQKLLGLWVENWEPLETLDGISVTLDDGREIPAGYFSERVHLEGAHAIGTFKDGPFPGLPAVTSHGFGRGIASYLATRPTPSFYQETLAELTERFGIRRPPVEAPARVEVTVRRRNSEQFLCILNHNDEPVTATLTDVSGTDLLTGNHCTEKVTIPAKDAAIIRCD